MKFLNIYFLITKYQGWARDRDVSDLRQSRDLSMVSSRSRLGAQPKRLGLVSVSTVDVSSRFRPFRSRAQNIFFFTQISLRWFESQPSKTHSNSQQLFRAEYRFYFMYYRA